MKSPDYEPHDKISLKVGFCVHQQQPSYIVLKVHVPVEHIPSSFDPDVIDGTSNIKVTLYAKNLPDCTVNNIRPYYVEGTPINPEANLPFIVRQTPEFELMKHEII